MKNKLIIFFVVILMLTVFGSAAQAQPAAPLLQTPAQREAVPEGSVTFSWNAASGATNYRLRIVKLAPGARPEVVFNRNVRNVTRHSVPAAIFDGSGTDYRWQVRAGNALGLGPWSAHRFFSVGELEVPVPLSPEQDEYVPGEEVTFSWEPVENALRYRLVVVDIDSGEVFFNRVVGNDAEHTVTGFPSDGTRYRWRVRAINRGGAGPLSNTARFFSGSEPAFFLVYPASDIWGERWKANAEITITIDDGVETKVYTVQSDDYGHFQLLFGEDHPIEPFEIEPGNVVTITDGETTISHIVKYLVINAVEPERGLIHGEAEPNSEIYVALHDDNSLRLHAEMVVAGSDGEWSADFYGKTLIFPDHFVKALCLDLDNFAATGFEWFFEPDDFAHPYHEITALLPLTGMLDDFGLGARVAMGLAVFDVNTWLEEEGMDWRVKLSVEDTGMDAQTAAEKLEDRSERGVKFFAGPMLSGEVAEVLDFANTHELLLVSPSATMPGLNSPGDFLFRFWYPDGITPPSEPLLGAESYHERVTNYLSDYPGLDFNEDIADYCYTSYDTIWVLALCIDEAGYDSVAVKEILPGITAEWSLLYGASGFIVLDENGDRALAD